MRYYLKAPEHLAITGPFELDEIEAKLKAGELSAGTLATGDIGEGLARIQNATPEDWVLVESIPGLSGERPPSSQLPLPKGVNAHPSTSSGMVFCPACGHKLAPGGGSACEHCGKGLAVFTLQPIKPQGNRLEGLPSKIAAVATRALWAFLQVLAGGMVILFLLGLLLSAICRR